jgi:hypothetical protein
MCKHKVKINVRENRRGNHKLDNTKRTGNIGYTGRRQKKKKHNTVNAIDEQHQKTVGEPRCSWRISSYEVVI